MYHDDCQKVFVTGQVKNAKAICLKGLWAVYKLSLTNTDVPAAKQQ